MRKIELTTAAQKRFEQLLQKDPQAQGVRVGLVRSGCNGFAYKIELTAHLDTHEQWIQAGAIRVAVKEQDMDKLGGMTIDWVKEGLNHRLSFNNPNTRSSCGCGSSVGFSDPS